MRFVLAVLLLILTLSVSAQKSLPDSTMKEFTRLTCECATLMRVDEGTSGEGIKNLRTCISTTLDVYKENGWIKEERLNDSAWTDIFYNEMGGMLDKNCPVYASLIKKMNDAPKIPVPKNQTPEKYFLAALSLKKRRFEPNPNATTGTMRRWSAIDMTHSNIQMLFDIRMVFKNEADASAYFRAKLDELSEGGELTTNSLKVYGAAESKVYGANPQLMGTFGDLDMAQYNFVFRVKNVVAKVFVSASKKATYNEAVTFAKEAIQRIKAAAL